MFSLHKTRGGVHPPQCKDVREYACTSVTPPERVRIPLNMHIGGPCMPCVKPGDHVYVGTLIGDGSGLYAPVHASVSGTVVSTDTEQLPTGATAPVVAIESDGKMENDPALAQPSYSTKEEFLDCVRASGAVGLGGAAFPTWFKMRAPEGKKFEFLVINGMECEPFITSDYRQMMEHAERVVDGVHRIATALEIPAAVIGIEDNKPEAIAKLTETVAAKGWSDLIDVMAIPTKYPAGGEKVLISATTGRDVPAGGLPVDVGCLVINVTTASRIEQYFRYGMPLVTKTLTLAGDCVANPGNYRVPIGMSVRDIIEATGGLTKEPRKIIMGGPMMGRTLTSIDCPIIKANNAILCLDDQAILPDETPCIRCGRCVRVCPLGLMPYALDSASRSHDAIALDELGIMNCMECGSCAYTCPAHRRITASIREGKGFYRSEVARLTQPAKGA
ncbi:electron transport complex subunit RsxC [Collinsella sp. An271]|uniref:electron transport complex subunit RsxC n=1 Tax=Collinsella sp. An271 TaxID=1965616 RepID=UPI000B3AC626|nr:electron transport complex subunit RsxC [Collinsella sp. An271]OUO60542.1 electron transport complex subunit RsxC [Collinsella sp. An271]